MGSFENTDPCVELKTRIPELPSIMRKHGWIISAYLMDWWLGGGANDNPNTGRHDTTTVRMDWILSHGRALAVYQSAKARKVWMSDLAKGVIIRKLIHTKGRLPKTVGEKLEIGNVGKGQRRDSGNVLPFHNDWHIQHQKFNENKLISPLDDMYGALGDFSFYYLVKGHVERLPDQGGQPRYRVTLNEVGVYVKDSYDFNDSDPNKKKRGDLFGWLATMPVTNVVASQPLGFWGCTSPYIGKLSMKQSHRYVNNYDFREWRKKHSKGYGGDFLVFSDIKVFDTNDSFEF